MRLTCPSCEAVYEVPEDAIPEGGRDVQCTNCGHGWFEGHPRAVAAPGADDPVAGDGIDDDLVGEPVPAGAGTAHGRPPVDPRSRRVLREEAEREVEARRIERRRLQAVEGKPRAAAARDRIEPPSAAEAGLSPAVGWDEPAPPRPRRGGGFALGFLGVLTLAALATAAYLYADELGRTAPALAGPLAAYADAVSEARIALDAAARSAMARLDDLLPAPADGG